MNTFERFKGALVRALAALRANRQPGEELIEAIDSADDWPTLESKLADLRTRSRRRQQEVLERLQPLADKVQELLAEAKRARIRVVRDNLLRQAEGYMQQLETEDQPAAVHGANCALINNLLKQVRRAQAMAASGVTADAVEVIAAQIEDITSEYETVHEAAHDLEAAQSASAPVPEPSGLLERLGALTVQDGEPDTPDALDAIERRFYAVQAE